jgi:hypothetical protein
VPAGPASSGEVPPGGTRSDGGATTTWPTSSEGHSEAGRHGQLARSGSSGMGNARPAGQEAQRPITRTTVTIRNMEGERPAREGRRKTGTG